MRIVIGGGPSTGKTTLARTMGGTTKHSDDLIGKLDWSAASLEVSTWMDQPGPWTIEGVATARALRKWLRAHPTGSPCDKVIWLRFNYTRLTAGQSAMAKGCETVLSEILGELKERGVEVEYR